MTVLRSAALRCVVLLTLFFAAALSYAAKGRQTTIRVVNTQTGQRQYSYYLPGTAGTSNTTCDTNATANSSGSTTDVNGTTNCTTTSTAGTRPQRINRYIAQAHVHAIMLNGMHITLWCQAGFRRCVIPQPGPYAAEIKGNSVWLYTYRLDGKLQKVKYHYVGGW